MADYTSPCPDCEGRGRHDVYRRERDGGFTDTGATSQCETCDGTGEVCRHCSSWSCPGDCRGPMSDCDETLVEMLGKSVAP